MIPDASPEGKGGLETSAPGCTGTFPAGLSLSGLPGLGPDSGFPATGSGEGGGGPDSSDLSEAPPGPSLPWVGSCFKTPPGLSPGFGDVVVGPESPLPPASTV